MSVLSTFPMGSTATGSGGKEVHVGAEAPTDESAVLWVDTDDESSGSGSSGSSVQPDWNQSDETASDYIKNRPFYQTDDGYQKLGIEYLPIIALQSVSLSESQWSDDNTLDVYAEGVTADNTVIVSPDPDSFSAWCEAGIRCIAQDTDLLTFACDNPPGFSIISANILIMG